MVPSFEGGRTGLPYTITQTPIQSGWVAIPGMVCTRRTEGTVGKTRGDPCEEHERRMGWTLPRGGIHKMQKATFPSRDARVEQGNLTACQKMERIS